MYRFRVQKILLRRGETVRLIHNSRSTMCKLSTTPKSSSSSNDVDIAKIRAMRKFETMQDKLVRWEKSYKTREQREIEEMEDLIANPFENPNQVMSRTGWIGHLKDLLDDFLKLIKANHVSDETKETVAKHMADNEDLNSVEMVDIQGFASDTGTSKLVKRFPHRQYSIIPKTGWCISATGWGNGASTDLVLQRNWHKESNLHDNSSYIQMKNSFLVGVNYLQVDGDELITKELETMVIGYDHNESDVMSDLLKLTKTMDRDEMVFAAKIQKPSKFVSDCDMKWMTQDTILESLQVSRELSGLASIDIAWLDVRGFEVNDSSMSNLTDALIILGEEIKARRITKIGLASSDGFTLNDNVAEDTTDFQYGHSQPVPLLAVLKAVEVSGVGKDLVGLQYPYNLMEHTSVTEAVTLEHMISYPTLGFTADKDESLTVCDVANRCKLVKITERPLTPPVDRHQRPFLMLQQRLEDPARDADDYMQEAIAVTKTGLEWESMYTRGEVPDMTDAAREIQKKIKSEADNRRSEEFDYNYDDPTVELPPPERMKWFQQLWDDLDTMDNTIDWGHKKRYNYTVPMQLVISNLMKSKTHREFAFGYQHIWMNLLRIQTEYLTYRDQRVLKKVGEALDAVVPALVKVQDQCNGKEEVMAKTIQLLHASKGTDVMITDFMKGHRYGVLNPAVDIKTPEAINAIQSFKWPYMYWTEASLQKQEAIKYYENAKKQKKFRFVDEQ